MKKFCLGIFGILVIFIITLPLLYITVAISTNLTPIIESLLFGTTREDGNSYVRMTDYKVWSELKLNEQKGLILGSSTAYRNINPFILDTITKINWFNLANTSQSPVVSLALLKQIVNSQSGNIDYVLLDACIPIIENNGYESAFDLIANSKMDFIQKADLFFIEPSFKMLNHFSYKTIKNAVPSQDYLLRNDNNGHYLGKGFTCSLNSRKKLSLSDFPKGVQYFKMTNEINQIKELCDEKEITLFINLAPVLNFDTFIFNTKGINLILNDDFNNRLDFFYDSHHMNCDGANFYTEKLALKLLSSGLMIKSN
jgi:hypothetical protein